MAGLLKVSNMIWVIFSRLAFGLSGASVRRTGCSSGATRKSVMPDLLHVIPVGDDTVLDRVFQGEDTSLALGFITDVRVFLTHTHHHTLVIKQNSWSIISSEPSLAHTGSIVHNERRYIIITHLDRFL
ncbi:GSCOCG00005977001-RA-CDS [Cotesia congregata]|nr:GSCOCG00005977001-RA-CDS [Cotesia congregata]